MQRRLAELDQEGVAGELILSGHQDAVLPFFSQTSDPAPPGIVTQGCAPITGILPT